MGIDNSNNPDEDATEGGKPDFDLWSDEGARRFNEIIEEGSAYALANPRLVENFDESIEDEECEHVDQELDDPGEETLSPGEMELIFENCFIM